MAKLSAKRLGVLRMVADAERSWEGRNGSFPGAYIPSSTSQSLEKYGLTLWDTGSFTTAEKAGLITGWKTGGGFVKLTDAGRRALKDQEQSQ